MGHKMEIVRIDVEDGKSTIEAAVQDKFQAARLRLFVEEAHQLFHNRLNLSSLEELHIEIERRANINEPLKI
jgi:hypothetical protein